MPASAPAQLLRVVLKLIAIGFTSLFMGFLLTPSTWKPKDGAPTRLSQVLAARASDDIALEATVTLTTFDRTPRALIALDVHIGPGTDYQVIGSLPRGASLDIVGRDASSQWVAVAFAGGTKINGWVPGLSVAGLPDVKALPLAPVTFLPR